MLLTCSSSCTASSSCTCHRPRSVQQASTDPALIIQGPTASIHRKTPVSTTWRPVSCSLLWGLLRLPVGRPRGTCCKCRCRCCCRAREHLATCGARAAQWPWEAARHHCTNCLLVHLQSSCVCSTCCCCYSLCALHQVATDWVIIVVINAALNRRLLWLRCRGWRRLPSPAACDTHMSSMPTGISCCCHIL